MYTYRFRKWMGITTRPLAAVPLIAAGLVSVGSPASAIDYSGPLVITKGGTYSGNWRSTLDQPAVYVNTDQPVTIENCNLRGPGTGIQGAYSKPVTLTVRNCSAIGEDTGAGREPGYFVNVSQPAALTVVHNTLDRSNGISIYGAADKTSSAPITVQYNKARNIGAIPADVPVEKMCTMIGFCRANFFKLYNVRANPNIDFSWNEVINEPGKSAMGDVVTNMYSSGTASSPIRIHDNYIQGVYDATPSDVKLSHMQGSGILIADSPTTDPDHSSAFTWAYNNQVINFSKYGMGIISGHDNMAFNNRILTSNLLPDGSMIATRWTGLAVHDSYHVGPGAFFNNVTYGNVVGNTWTSGGKISSQNCSTADAYDLNIRAGLCAKILPGNTDFNTPAHPAVTVADEATEFTNWQQKLIANSAYVGTTPPPLVTAIAAGDVVANKAKLRANINPMGTETSVSFLLGTDPQLRDGVVVQAEKPVIAGLAEAAVMRSVPNLMPGQTYYYRAVAANSVAAVAGDITSFTTLRLPKATARSAQNVTSTSAALNGYASANGIDETTQVYQVSPDADFAKGVISVVPDETIPLGSTSNKNMSATVTGLTKSTTYYVRLIATNKYGSTVSNVVTVTTKSS